MSARHTRIVDARLNRLAELRQMMGNDRGIQRIVCRPPPVDPDLCTPVGLTPIISIWRAYENRVGGFLETGQRGDPAFLVARGRVKVIELPDDFGVIPTETDMRHWAVLAKEKRALEMANADPSDVRRWYPGWVVPLAHTPMFGTDRFRKFDPTPSFETVIGPLRFVNR